MFITILAGFFSGIVSGMGIGGGAILIPILTMFLNVGQQGAQCVNLVYFIPTAIAALVIHIKNKSVDFKAALPIIAFGIIGAILGSWIAVYMSADVLRKIFAVFLFAVGINQFFGKKEKSS